MTLTLWPWTLDLDNLYRVPSGFRESNSMIFPWFSMILSCFSMIKPTQKWWFNSDISFYFSYCGLDITPFCHTFSTKYETNTNFIIIIGICARSAKFFWIMPHTYQLGNLEVAVRNSMKWKDTNVCRTRNLFNTGVGYIRKFIWK